jgi:hypothetical protein
MPETGITDPAKVACKHQIRHPVYHAGSKNAWGEIGLLQPNSPTQMNHNGRDARDRCTCISTGRPACRAGDLQRISFIYRTFLLMNIPRVVTTHVMRAEQFST